MKLKGFVLLLIIGMMLNCHKNLSINDQNDGTFALQETVTITVNMDQEKQIQDEVDKGHQPWRLDPILVSESFMASFRKDKDKVVCSVVDAKENETTVLCEGEKRKYFVHLKRLVKKDGIWTVTSVDTVRN